MTVINKHISYKDLNGVISNLEQEVERWKAKAELNAASVDLWIKENAALKAELDFTKERLTTAHKSYDAIYAALCEVQQELAALKSQEPVGVVEEVAERTDGQAVFFCISTAGRMTVGTKLFASP